MARKELPPFCQYEIWSKEAGCLVPCQKLGTAVIVGHRRVCLCDEHKAFAADALNDYEVRLYNLKKKQKAARIRGQIKQLQLELKQGDV